MSTADLACGAALSSPQGGARRREALRIAGVFAVCWGACALLALLLGRDLNWDYFNYHDYAALSSTDDRLGQDFFPAGYQGHLNPLPFLPFQLMLEWKWNSVAIAITLAGIQSLNLLFLYLIARDLAVASNDRRAWVPTLVTVLGGLSGAIACQIGSTFVDPTTTPLVMAAVWLILRSDRAKTNALAAFLGGMAVALKLTNIVYAAGIAAALVVSAGALDWRSALRRALQTGGAMTAGFLVLYGVWGARLHAEYGSPFFPLFNGIFQSPYFSTDSVAFHRFVPQSLMAALRLPFEMAEVRSWIYTETPAPDLRPAVLVALFLAWCTRRLVAAHYGRGEPLRLTWPAWVRSRWLAFGSVSLIAWLLTSSNGRYAVPLLLLLGPGLYLVATALMGRRWAAVALGFLAALQFIHVASAGNPRWNPQPWAEEWLPSTVPASLTLKPNLILTIGPSSESYLARLVHPQSVFVNPIGLISLSTAGPSGDRLKELLAKFEGNTKIVFMLGSKFPREEVRSAAIRRYSTAVDRFGLQIEPSSCEAIALNAGAGLDIGIPGFWGEPSARYLLSCDAPRKTPSPELAAARARAKALFDDLEKRCPDIYRPRQPEVEGTGRVWSRLYGQYDLFVAVNFETGEVFQYMEHQAIHTLVGRVDTWERDLSRHACALPQNGSRGIATLRPNAAH